MVIDAVRAAICHSAAESESERINPHRADRSLLSPPLLRGNAFAPFTCLVICKGALPMASALIADPDIRIARLNKPAPTKRGKERRRRGRGGGEGDATDD